MKSLFESRILNKVKTAISIEENFGFILYQTGIQKIPEPIKMFNFNNYVSALKETKNPEAGDLITWEENDFLGNLVKYAGILIDEKNHTILHKDRGEIYLDTAKEITNLYGTRYTRINYYKLP